ncbi:MAG: transglycosylase SLT domain-containing protein [Bdellovibrionales bacterium]
MRQKHFFFIPLLLLGLMVIRADAIVAVPTDGIEPTSSEADVDTPVLPEAIERPPTIGVDQPWAAPSYSNQEKALGYGVEAFKTPAGMEERVAFWVDIYTKYTTDQGLLHDSRYINLIYESVDFSDLVQNESLSLRQKEKARRDRVKQAKKQIEERLLRLQKLSSPEGLEGDDLRYWNLFANVIEPKKFYEASRRGRLRFQLGQRDRFMEGIYQSGRHIKEMEEIFKREGLPLELTRLPFVESSFNLKARSKVGASGIWQFMRSTARSYMRMDGSVDERNDPLRSTVAAARKLRNNYEMLQSWPLAVTGYNHGPSGVQRLVRKFQTNNLAELTDVRKGRFGFASANFYASFLAAVQVEQAADKYFGPLPRMAELRGTEIKLSRPLAVKQIITWFGEDLSKAQTYNPHVRSHIWPKGTVQGRNFIRVTNEVAAQAQQDLNQGKVATITEAPLEDNEYVLQEGETLSEIAERFKVKVQMLMDMNGITDARRIRAKQRLIIPVKQALSGP